MKRIIAITTLLMFLINTIVPLGWAQSLPVSLPASAAVPAQEAIFKGLRVFPDKPYRLDFIVQSGTSQANDGQQQELSRQIHYFLAALTVPENDLWVNLAPQDRDRIIPDTLGQTELGRDLLEQDYQLKKITSEFLQPDHEFGREFWDKVHQKIYEEFGETDLSADVLHRIWIIPDRAQVFAHGPVAYVTSSRLKVLLEEDYRAFPANVLKTENPSSDLTKVQTQMLRDVLLPVIEQEVNEGPTFSRLRQLYNAVILAAWYKRHLKKSILAKVYVNQNKIGGISLGDKAVAQTIYQKYLDVFQGSLGKVVEEYDPVSQEVVARQYWTGGIQASGVFDTNRVQGLLDENEQSVPSSAEVAQAMMVELQLDPLQQADPEITGQESDALFDRAAMNEELEEFWKWDDVSQKKLDPNRLFSIGRSANIKKKDGSDSTKRADMSQEMSLEFRPDVYFDGTEDIRAFGERLVRDGNAREFNIRVNGGKEITLVIQTKILKTAFDRKEEDVDIYKEENDVFRSNVIRSLFPVIENFIQTYGQERLPESIVIFEGETGSHLFEADMQKGFMLVHKNVSDFDSSAHYLGEASNALVVLALQHFLSISQMTDPEDLLEKQQLKEDFRFFESLPQRAGVNWLSLRQYAANKDINLDNLIGAIEDLYSDTKVDNFIQESGARLRREMTFRYGEISRKFFEFRTDYAYGDLNQDYMDSWYKRALSKEFYIFQYVEKLFEEALGEEAKEYELIILPDMDMVNAFVTPDKKIYISGGLLKFIKYPSELQNILLHETTHAVRQHSLVSLHRFLLQEGDFSFDQYLENISLKRLFEYEADLRVFIEGKTKVNPLGLKVFMDRLEEVYPETIRNRDMTHGAARDRALNMETLFYLLDLENLSSDLGNLDSVFQSAIEEISKDKIMREIRNGAGFSSFDGEDQRERRFKRDDRLSLANIQPDHLVLWIDFLHAAKKRAQGQANHEFYDHLLTTFTQALEEQHLPEGRFRSQKESSVARALFYEMFADLDYIFSDQDWRGRVMREKYDADHDVLRNDQGFETIFKVLASDAFGSIDFPVQKRNIYGLVEKLLVRHLEAQKMLRKEKIEIAKNRQQDFKYVSLIKNPEDITRLADFVESMARSFEPFLKSKITNHSQDVFVDTVTFYAFLLLMPQKPGKSNELEAHEKLLKDLDKQRMILRKELYRRLGIHQGSSLLQLLEKEDVFLEKQDEEEIQEDDVAEEETTSWDMNTPFAERMGQQVFDDFTGMERYDPKKYQGFVKELLAYPTIGDVEGILDGAERYFIRKMEPIWRKLDKKTSDLENRAPMGFQEADMEAWDAYAYYIFLKVFQEVVSKHKEAKGWSAVHKKAFNFQIMTGAFVSSSGRLKIGASSRLHFNVENDKFQLKSDSFEESPEDLGFRFFNLTRSQAYGLYLDFIDSNRRLLSGGDVITSLGELYRSFGLSREALEYQRAFQNVENVWFSQDYTPEEMVELYGYLYQVSGESNIRSYAKDLQRELYVALLVKYLAGKTWGDFFEVLEWFENAGVPLKQVIVDNRKAFGAILEGLWVTMPKDIGADQFKNLLTVMDFIDDPLLRNVFRIHVIEQFLPKLDFDQKLDFLFSPQVAGYLSYAKLNEFIERDVNTEDQHRKLVQRMRSEYDRLSKQGSKDLGLGVILDYFDAHPHSAHEFLIALLKTRTDDRFLKDFIVQKISIAREDVENSFEEIAANRHLKNKADISSDIFAFEAIYKKILSMDEATKMILLRKLLTGPDGIIVNKGRRKTFLRELLNSIVAHDPRDQDLRDVIEDVIDVIGDMDQWRTIYFGIQPILLERMALPPTREHPWYDVPKIQEALEFDQGRLDDLKTSLFKSFYIDSDAIKDRKNVVWRHERFFLLHSEGVLRQQLMKLGYIREEPPEAQLSEVDFTVKVAERVPFYGPRTMQMLPYFIVLSDKYRNAFKDVYDNLKGQNKMNAMSVVQRQWPDMWQEVEEFGKRIGGGSMMTVYLLNLLSGDEDVVKVLNPNLEYHLDGVGDFVEDVIDRLIKKNPAKYGAAKGVFRTVRQWALRDIKLENFLERDQRFRKLNDGFQPEGFDYHLTTGLSKAPVGSGFLRESFAPGENLTSWDSLAKDFDIKQIVSLLVKNYIHQIKSGLVHPDLHEGNIRIDRNAVEKVRVVLLDRNLLLDIPAPVQDFLNIFADPMVLFTKTSADMTEDIVRLSENPVEETQRQKLEILIRDIMQSLQEGRLERMETFLADITDIGLKLPLEVELIFKNINVLQKMARRAGFENGLAEALFYVPEADDPGADGAMVSGAPKETGGIDLTASQMNLDVREEQVENFDIDHAVLTGQKSAINGFQPVILNIRPASELSGLLGLSGIP